VPVYGQEEPGSCAGRVTNVVVSYQDKTAVVTYDDAKTELKALTSATTNAGYPSAPKR